MVHSIIHTATPITAASTIHFGVQDTSLMDFMIPFILDHHILIIPGDGTLAGDLDGAVTTATVIDIPLTTHTEVTLIITHITIEAT